MRLVGLRRLLRVRLRSRTRFEGEYHLPDLDGVTLLHQDIFNSSSERRRYFDHGFVGFKLDYWLAFGDLGSRGNHQAHQVALMNVFAKFRKLEFSHYNDFSVMCSPCTSASSCG